MVIVILFLPRRAPAVFLILYIHNEPVAITRATYIVLCKYFGPPSNFKIGEKKIVLFLLLFNRSS